MGIRASSRHGLPLSAAFPPRAKSDQAKSHALTPSPHCISFFTPRTRQRRRRTWRYYRPPYRSPEGLLSRACPTCGASVSMPISPLSTVDAIMHLRHSPSIPLHEPFLSLVHLKLPYLPSPLLTTCESPLWRTNRFCSRKDTSQLSVADYPYCLLHHYWTLRWTQIASLRQT